MNMMLTGATAENLRRKAAYADTVQLRDGVPVFSWVDISVTDRCNRSAGSPKACVFCPRIDPAVYPNQNLNMAVPLAEKIGEELRALDYRGAIALCGFGEPLLHPQIVEIVQAFRGLRVEIVTNGDRLNHAMIHYLVEAGTAYFIVSCYDGEHQIPLMDALFREAGYGRDHYILRDRWHGAEKEYGLKLTNRAGTINVGPQPDVDVNHRCWYMTYSMQVDWNGDVTLCPQDWRKLIKLGNLNLQGVWEVWTGKIAHKHRMRLIAGRRDVAPCSSCNAQGDLHGHNHAEAWAKA